MTVAAEISIVIITLWLSGNLIALLLLQRNNRNREGQS
jgi:hypothetical protein